MMKTTYHPKDARYFASRTRARAACQAWERVTRLGRFANGSFGCYAPLKSNGQYVGGNPDPQIIVWMVSH